MAMFNRGLLQDQAQIYRGRYRYAATSIAKEDNANAESYRLAADMYQQIANDMIGPEGLPEPDAYTDALREKWAKFVATGIIDDGALEAELAHVAERADHRGDRPRRPRLDPALRDLVDPRAIEPILAEMSEILGVEYTPPPIEHQVEAETPPAEATRPETPPNPKDRRREPATK